MTLSGHMRKGMGFVLLFLLAGGSGAFGQGPGQLRLMKERAEIVTKRKNLFVERVLDSYTIPFQKNDQGVVVQIALEGKWYDLERIEIIPIGDRGGPSVKESGHEIYFFTRDGHILMLLSDIRIH